MISTRQEINSVKELSSIDSKQQQELFQLKEKIKHHNLLYYQENKPEITDAEYDELVKKVDVQIVGAAPDERFSKVKHIVPMLSLDKSYAENDIEKFLSRAKRFLNVDELEIICEAKIDGLSFSAIYEDGVFIKAATRGDGYFGEDVTNNVVTIKNLPKNLFTIF